MSGPSLFYQSCLCWQQQPSPSSAGVWLGLHGFFRLVLQPVLDFTQSLLTCCPSLARCFEASLSRSDTSQSGFRCCAKRMPLLWLCDTAWRDHTGNTKPASSSEACALLSWSSQFIRPWAKFGKYSMVSDWFRNTDYKTVRFVWLRVTVAGAGMLWPSYALATASIMFRDWSPELLQLLRPFKSYEGQVHETLEQLIACDCRRDFLKVLLQTRPCSMQRVSRVHAVLGN